MGYYAQGELKCKLKKGVSVKRTDFDEFGIEVEVDTGRDLYAVTDGKYNEDVVLELLDRLTEIIDDGTFEFEGEDGTKWRFRFYGGSWSEENYIGFYDSHHLLENGITIDTEGFYPEIKVKVDGGELIVFVSNDGYSKQACVAYRHNETGVFVDLCFAEIKSNGILNKNENGRIDIYNFTNPYDEDYTHKYSIRLDSITSALNEMEIL